MEIFEKFKIGLSKSSKNFSEGIKNLVINKKVDSKTLNHLEDFLIESDVGVVAAKELKQIFADTKIDPKKDSLNQINLIVEESIQQKLNEENKLRRVIKNLLNEVNEENKLRETIKSLAKEIISEQQNFSSEKEMFNLVKKEIALEEKS